VHEPRAETGAADARAEDALVEREHVGGTIPHINDQGLAEVAAGRHPQPPASAAMNATASPEASG
jgi:hypothetical protein